MSDEDGIRSDERERLSARVYELGWCPTCARNLDAAELAAAITVDPAEVLSPEELAEYERCQQSVIDARRRAPMVEGEIVVGGRVPASSEPRPENPYRTVHARMSPPGAAWDEGFASRQPEIDRLKAERDEATRQREQAATSRNVIAEQRDKAIDRLVRLEREGEHLARPAAEKLVSLTREGEEWAAEQRQTIHDLGRVKAAEGRRLSRLEDALKHLREFVQDGEVRRVIDAALDGEDWDA